MRMRVLFLVGRGKRNIRKNRTGGNLHNFFCFVKLSDFINSKISLGRLSWGLYVSVIQTYIPCALG